MRLRRRCTVALPGARVVANADASPPSDWLAAPTLRCGFLVGAAAVAAAGLVVVAATTPCSYWATVAAVIAFGFGRSTISGAHRKAADALLARADPGSARDLAQVFR